MISRRFLRRTPFQRRNHWIRERHFEETTFVSLSDISKIHNDILEFITVEQDYEDNTLLDYTITDKELFRRFKVNQRLIDENTGSQSNEMLTQQLRSFIVGYIRNEARRRHLHRERELVAEANGTLDEFSAAYEVEYRKEFAV
jgi:hypothetical protein